MAPPKDYMVKPAMITGRDWRRKAGPFYGVKEVATFFFAMSPSWLRLKLNPDNEHPLTWFVQDGERMNFHRLNPDRGVESARVFTLADIEPMARSLRAFGAISQNRLAQVLSLVKAEADLFGLFEDPEEAGEADQGGAVPAGQGET